MTPNIRLNPSTANSNNPASQHQRLLGAGVRVTMATAMAPKADGGSELVKNS